MFTVGAVDKNLDQYIVAGGYSHLTTTLLKTSELICCYCVSLEVWLSLVGKLNINLISDQVNYYFSRYVNTWL